MRKVIPLVLLLAGCQYVPMLPGLSAHKVDIQQGNYVTQEMVDKVKPGMSRSQVRFALGTPLVVDPFHANRWDYIFVNQKKGRVLEQRRVIVVFLDDKVLRIEGEGAPSTSPGVSTKPAPAASRAGAAKPADAAAGAAAQ